MPSVPLPLLQYTFTGVICPIFIFIVDTDATIQLSNVKSSWLGNMEREIDHEIAAVDHRYGAEKAKPSIALSQSIYTVHVHAGCRRQQQQ